MTCTSGSVQTVADKTVAAKAQIDKLLAMLQAQESVNKTRFFDEINAHLKDARVADARQLSYNSDIKTEYTSEFSLDKIAAVVTSALKAVAAAKDPNVKAPAMSPEAIQAYTDVVNRVAEAAKSSSTASASLSFSMTRLSPGLFAFLYASSVNIKDEDTFGSEAVTSTAIYYRLMQSIEDVKMEADYGAARIDADNFLKMKTVQAALTDDLADGKISIEEWSKKDAAYTAAIQRIQERLDADHFKSGAPRVAARERGPESALSQQIVRSAIERLARKGAAFKAAVETSNARLAGGYY